MRKTTFVAMLLLCLSLCGIATAAEKDHPLASEQSFRAFWRDKAVAVSPGVWEVESAPGVWVRAAFGAEGLTHDIQALRGRVEEAELQQVLGTPDAKGEKRAAWLREKLTQLEALQLEAHNKAAVSGSLCLESGTAYEFHLEGASRVGSTGREVYSLARVGIGVDFGPYPPYAHRYADTAITTRTSTNGCRYAFSSDSITDHSLGIAEAFSRVPCGSNNTFCAGWLTESYIALEACPAGYRSLFVSSGSLGNCLL